jgi:predicted metal-dependent hydrolase
VNAVYFEGRMPKPALVWNRTLTARKFGHYQPVRDTVMVSVSLDDPKVPAYVVDFVMYHELLHKKHGVTTLNGRRLAHSPEFRADERRYAEYREAERLLNELALRQRGLSGL